MKRRRWDSKTKTKIVLEGLSGRPMDDVLGVPRGLNVQVVSSRL